MGKAKLEVGKELRGWRAGLDEFATLWESGIERKDVA